MKDKLSINISMADRPYPLTIDRSDEEFIRKAVKFVNDKVLQYRQKYTDKDNQDFLSMIVLQTLVKLYEYEDKSDFSPLLDEIENMSNELSEFLKNE